MFVFFGPSLLLPPSLSSLNPSPLLEGGHGALRAQPLCWVLCLLLALLGPSITTSLSPAKLPLPIHLLPISALQAPALCFQLLQNLKPPITGHICITGQSPPGPAGSFEREAVSAELSLLHLLGPAEWRSCQQLWTGTCYFLALCLHLKIGRVPHVWWGWRKAECFYENLRAARLHPVNTSDRPKPRR